MYKYLRLALHLLKLLPACVKHPDVILPNLVVLLLLSKQKIDDLREINECRLTMTANVLSGTMQSIRDVPSDSAILPLMFFFAYSGAKICTSTT